MAAISLNEYNSAVAKIRGLLTNWLDVGVELFLALREIERSDVWKAPGHAGFQDFLKAEFPNALGLERYNNVISAIELHGADFIRKIGVDSAHAVSVQAVRQSPERATLIRASIEKHIEKQGVAPDTNRIRDIVRGACPEIVKPTRETRAVMFDVEMVEENKRLKREVAMLQRENAKLKRELAKASKA